MQVIEIEIKLYRMQWLSISQYTVVGSTLSCQSQPTYIPILREPETKVQVIKSLEKVFEDQSLLVAFSFASDSFEFLETA